jgi:hypothetical protein
MSKLPKGYGIRRTAHGYVGYLKGANGPLWETLFDYDRQNVVLKCREHWRKTCRAVDAAIAAAKGGIPRQHHPGCYRLSLDSARFAQFVRGRYYDSPRLGESFVTDTERGRWWKVEIRESATGNLLRFAGVHRTLRGAAHEVKSWS